MAGPDANLDRLERFCGSWQGKVTVPPNPQLPEGMEATSRAETTRELGGWFYFMDYEQHQPGGSVYRARGVLGYDGEHDRYTFHWFDSQGWNPAAPARGQWDGDRLILEQVSQMGHNRMVFDFSDDGYAFSMYASEDGQQWSPIMNESFKPAS